MRTRCYGKNRGVFLMRHVLGESYTALPWIRRVATAALGIVSSRCAAELLQGRQQMQLEGVNQEN